MRHFIFIPFSYSLQYSQFHFPFPSHIIDPGALETIAEGRCGNGIKENNEQCDCGGVEGCKTNNCCNLDCTFKAGAECDLKNDPCCTALCKLAPSGQVCRPSRSECDFQETCSGVTSACPEDKTKPNGDSCSISGGTCASGFCTSRDLQCTQRAGSMQISGACSASNFKTECTIACQSTGSSTCVLLSGFFVDGTPCGYKSFCAKGECLSQNSSTLDYFLISIVFANVTHHPVVAKIANWAIANPAIAVVVFVIVIGFILFLIFNCVRCVRRAIVNKKLSSGGQRYPTSTSQATLVGAHRENDLYNNTPYTSGNTEYLSSAPFQQSTADMASNNASRENLFVDPTPYNGTGAYDPYGQNQFVYPPPPLLPELAHRYTRSLDEELGWDTPVASRSPSMDNLVNISQRQSTSLYMPSSNHLNSNEVFDVDLRDEHHIPNPHTPPPRAD